jgi:hypothetical protein
LFSGPSVKRIPMCIKGSKPVSSTDELLSKGPLDFLRENAAPGLGGGPDEMSQEAQIMFSQYLNSVCTNAKFLINHLGECYIKRLCDGIDAKIYITCEGTISLLTRFQDTNRNSGWLVGNDQFKEILKLVNEMNDHMEAHKSRCQIRSIFHQSHSQFEEDLDLLSESINRAKHLWYREPASVQCTQTSSNHGPPDMPPENTSPLDEELKNTFLLLLKNIKSSSALNEFKEDASDMMKKMYSDKYKGETDPFHCYFCGTNFKRSGNRKNHIKKVCSIIKEREEYLQTSSASTTSIHGVCLLDDSPNHDVHLQTPSSSIHAVSYLPDSKPIQEVTHLADPSTSLHIVPFLTDPMQVQLAPVDLSVKFPVDSSSTPNTSNLNISGAVVTTTPIISVPKQRATDPFTQISKDPVFKFGVHKKMSENMNEIQEEYNKIKSIKEEDIPKKLRQLDPNWRPSLTLLSNEAFDNLLENPELMVEYKTFAKKNLQSLSELTNKTKLCRRGKMSQPYDSEEVSRFLKQNSHVFMSKRIKCLQDKLVSKSKPTSIEESELYSTSNDNEILQVSK